MVFLAPLNLVIDKSCDTETGTFTLNLTPQGGLPGFNGSFYTLIGTAGGILGVGDVQTVTLPFGSPQAYNFTLSDVAGCSYSVADSFACQILCDPATQVVAGTVADLAPVCAGNPFTATTTGTALFDGDVLGYVLHANPFDNVLDPATHLDFNTSGYVHQSERG